MDLRKKMRYILKMENITKEEFFEQLLSVKDATDRQKIYFDEVRDLIFVDQEKSIFDKIDDKEVDINI